MLALVVLQPACGSSDERPPAAEPARSPQPDRRPAGRVVPIGNKPEGLVADAATGIVAAGLTDPDRLALVEGRSGRVLRRVDLPGSPRHLKLARPGGPVLVPAEAANALAEVSLPGGALRRTGVGNHPHDVTAAGGRVFVADELGNTLSVVQGGRRIKTLPTPRQPGGVTAAAGGTRIGLVAVYDREVQTYDAEALRPLERADAGVGPTHVLSDGANLLFVADTDGDALLLFRLRPRLRLIRRVFLPGEPYAMAIDPERRRLWVTLTARNEVVELSAGAGPAPLRRFPTVRQPNSVAIDRRTGRVFVSSRTDGTLQLIDPDEERVAPQDRPDAP